MCVCVCVWGGGGACGRGGGAGGVRGRVACHRLGVFTGGGGVPVASACGAWAQREKRRGGASQPGQGQRSACVYGVVCGVPCAGGLRTSWVGVCVSGVRMCVCAVCRRGVRAGMRVVCRVPLWVWVWVWVWPVGARGGGAETEAQRHS